MGEKICLRSKTKDILEPEFKLTQKPFSKASNHRRKMIHTTQHLEK